MQRVIVVVFVFLTAVFTMPAQEWLSGSLFYADETPGRVSYIDMIVKGKVGMQMKRADGEVVTIAQKDIDFAEEFVSKDGSVGSVYRDEDGNVVIIISTTHRRILSPDGGATEVFEDAQEFKNFFFAFARKYSKVIKGIDKKGKYHAYVTAKIPKDMSNRFYIRVKPYEQICVMESINYPVQGLAYREMRATEEFVRENPDTAYVMSTKDNKKFVFSSVQPVIRLAENDYFSLVQGVGSTNVNNEVNVSEETVKYLESREDLSEITAQEMDSLFDGSLLNAEVIVGRGEGISSAIYNRMRSE